jgi:hypothetical protein
MNSILSLTGFCTGGIEQWAVVAKPKKRGKLSLK